jgi:hypothetical protein
MVTCRRCGETRAEDRFRVIRGYRIHTCRLCEVRRVTERRKKDPNARAKRRALQVRANRRVKLETMARYGGICVCCKESEPVFLTIDHQSGGGGAHRRSLGGKTGAAFYRWLRDQGYPPGYRVLCFNCNFASFWGTCPHNA